MRVFVTGGAGYIGSVATAMLADAGHEVVVFDSLELGHREAVDPRARLIVGDLRDAESVEQAMAATKPDAVMHFAAYALVGESMTAPERYFENNVAGGINLARAMLKTGVRRIVFSSTCATYGQPDTTSIDEAMPQRPTNPYGQSKLMFEQILTWYARIHGLQPIFLRYFNACGATQTLGEDHTPESHVIPLLLQVAQGQRRRFCVYGDDYETPDGSCVRDYIHVSDLARAHMLALTTEATGAFNLGTGQGVSVLEMLAAARRVTGHALPAEIGPRRAGDPAYLVASPARAREVLGWTAEITAVEAIVRSAWDWRQRHPNGYAGA